MHTRELSSLWIRFNLQKMPQDYEVFILHLEKIHPFAFYGDP